MKIIASRDNATYKHLRDLAEDARYRRDQHATILDGLHLIETALAHGIVLRRLCVTRDAQAKPEALQILRTVSAQDCELLELSDALMRSLSPVENPTGLLAEIAIPNAEATSSIDADVIALDRVQDAGNLGTLLRTAAAAGIRHAWLGEGCAQAWSPKVLRAGMGAHFSMRIEERLDLRERAVHFAGLRIATVLGNDSRSLYDCDLRAPSLWLFGSEGAGLSQDLRALATLPVVIPMPGGAESLNVSAAAAVCLFEQLRQRQK